MSSVILKPDRLIDAQGRYEVQRSNMYQVVIPIGDSNTASEISLAIESFPALQMAIEATELHYGGSSVKVATAKATFDAGDITFKDFVIADTEKELLKWFSECYNPRTGQFGLAHNYKKTCQLNEYGVDGNNTRIWVMQGVWLSSFQSGEFNVEEGGKKQINCTLQWDRVYRDDVGF